ncbi:MAG TPA: hypothetical protein VK998_11625 [Schnuerera sp.]|nr:hypothetical protein [Schnuerera sp.]HSH36885.1 hypothetical protein [Schnuerera sp.]
MLIAMCLRYPGKKSRGINLPEKKDIIANLKALIPQLFSVQKQIMPKTKSNVITVKKDKNVLIIK